jgi:hypothetical protein
LKQKQNRNGIEADATFNHNRPKPSQRIRTRLASPSDTRSFYFDFPRGAFVVHGATTPHPPNNMSGRTSGSKAGSHRRKNANPENQE